MKPFTRNLVTISLLLLAFNPSTAQQTSKSRQIKKEFQVRSDVTLRANISYAEIACLTWDKDIVSVIAEVEADSHNEKTAHRILERFDPNISGSAGLVEIKWNGLTATTGSEVSDIHVSFKVYLPQTGSLDITSRFGSLYAESTRGNVNLSVDYGNLTLKRFDNPGIRIGMKFSTGTIESLSDASIDLRYTTLSIGSASVLSLNSKFSTITIEKATGIKLESSYDNLKINRVSGIDGSGRFSNMTIATLINRLQMDLEYGGMEVETVNPGFSLIDINSSFNSVKMGISPEASYELKADMSFGDCKYPLGATVSVKEPSPTSRIITGRVGSSASSSSKVNIKGRNCEVRLY